MFVSNAAFHVHVFTQALNWRLQWLVQPHGLAFYAGRRAKPYAQSVSPQPLQKVTRDWRASFLMLVALIKIGRSFQGVLGTLRSEKRLDILAERQGMEKGGRSLLAKVCKLQVDLEGVSHNMDR